jgi:hypothetical protein
VGSTRIRSTCPTRSHTDATNPSGAVQQIQEPEISRSSMPPSNARSIEASPKSLTTTPTRSFAGSRESRWRITEVFPDPRNPAIRFTWTIAPPVGGG